MRARGLLIRPICGCGNKAISSGINIKGKQTFKTRCKTCINKARKQVKNYCESCEKKWESGIRFDTDHIDGNPSNNDPSNLQTLCRPCHIEKTKKDKKNAKKMS